MTDRILHVLLWTSVMGLVAACAVGSLALGYGGILTMLSEGGAAPVGRLASSVGLGVATLLLCRHINDLIDR